jgi:hypothetical protein
MNHKRILFICKNRQLVYGEPGDYGVNTASGLRTSVGFSVELLRQAGYAAEAVDVIDNNCIDREVTRFRPTHVIIEALWVVPEKFAVLARLHPHVRWFVRLHSELPFLAREGMSMGWIQSYVDSGLVKIAPNSERLYDELGALYGYDNVVLLPNYYPMSRPRERFVAEYSDIHISCFGAIRLLKNHLTQAVAAIEFARKLGKYLHFHINVGRTDKQADPVLKNLRALFAATPDASLREHQWMPHKRFRYVVGLMDIGMQVSLSETFNIVAADQVDAGVPVVVSPEISWTSRFFQADPNSVSDIVRVLGRAWKWRRHSILHDLNRQGLARHNRWSAKKWLAFLK